MDAALHVSQGTAWKVIAATAKRLGADLIVLGSVGRHGLPGLLLGNTAERVLHASGSSVLVVKPAGFSAAPQGEVAAERREQEQPANSAAPQ